MAFSIGKIDEFDSNTETFTCYMERLEQYFEINEIKDEKKVAALLALVGPKTYGLLRDLTQPAKPKDKSFDDLTKLLSTHFNPKPLIIAERFRFYKRSQRQDESVNEFIVSLRKLSEHCEFGASLNDMLRDALVCGLKNENIQKRLLSEKKLTLETATDLAVAMECAQKDVKELHGHSSPQVNKLTMRKKEFKPPVGKSQIKPQMPESTCYRCNRRNHTPSECRFKNATCNSCGKAGHISPACLSSKNKHKQAGTKKKQANVHNVDNDPDVDIGCLFQMQSLEQDSSSNDRKVIWITPNINGKTVKMELDTGSGVSVIPKVDFERLFPKVYLDDTDLVLKTYSGEEIRPLGIMRCKVEVNGQQDLLNLYVVENGSRPLFGREWLRSLQLNWSEIKSMDYHRGQTKEKLNELKSKYSSVFEETLGKVKGHKAKLNLKPNAKPKFMKARTVAFAMKPKIEKELERLVTEGVLEKVKHSEWATPIVPVTKSNGEEIRICGDFKVTVNPAIDVEQYPLPSIDHIFAQLGKGKKFSKIDLKNAYLQLEVEDESKELLTINTHKGLFRYHRLVFGVSSAPAIFQRLIEQIVGDIPNVEVILDDMIITDPDGDDGHLKTLENVLSRLDEYGLKVNVNKCEFMQDKIKFCGHEIDRNGLHKTDEKVEAIVNAPPIKNVKDLRSFLGLTQYYAKFLPNLATVLHPLHHLLSKDVKWTWTHECENAVKTVKQMITSDLVLMNYDPDLPVVLACDASSFGLGTVLSHTLPNGTERPIAFASRSLSKSERNYSQIDKEALSLIWGIKKFHAYVYGREFTLVTDHKPLLSIFSPNKGVSVTTAARLQRYAVFLSGYSYNIKHKGTKQHGNCDGLSRLPLGIADTNYIDESEIFYTSQFDNLPVSCEQVARATQRDQILCNVYELVMKGIAPADRNTSKVYEPYINRYMELSVHQGCLMWGSRVIIPLALQQSVLNELHQGHVGVVKMKALARSYVWWTNIDQDIEAIARSCKGCNESKPSAPEAPIHPWEFPGKPWSRLHIDFAGPFMGHMFFVLVDSYSKWPIVKIMKTTTTAKTTELLRAIFADYGLCDEIVSDNGPQFSSEEFQNFLKMNGIKHIRSAPYHPKTNGLAERFVQTFKTALKASKSDDGTLQTKLSRFLMQYRNSEHATTNETPAKLLFNRKLTTRLDKVKPSIESRVTNSQSKMVRSQRDRNYSVKDPVMVRDYRDTHEKWIPGVVKTQTGPVSYRVEIAPGVEWRRHADQIRAADISPTPVEIPETFLASGPVTDTDQESVSEKVKQNNSPVLQSETPTVQLRRSTRTTRKPNKLDL